MKVLLINIISGIIILLIFLLIMIFDHQDSKKKITQIKFICLSGILVALSLSLNTTGGFILKTFLPYKIFEINLGCFLLILTSFFCGGLLGFVSGIASDFLGLLFISSGTPSLFFTLTSVLWSILPYYLVLSFNKIYYSKKTIYWYVPIAYTITLLIISGSDPIILKILYSLPLPLWSMYLPRIIKFPIELVVNVFLIISCYLSLRKTLNLENQFKKNYFATDPQSLQYNKVYKI